jgi:hypothetical protein
MALVGSQIVVQVEYGTTPGFRSSQVLGQAEYSDGAKIRVGQIVASVEYFEQPGGFLNFQIVAQVECEVGPDQEPEPPIRSKDFGSVIW